MLSYARLGLPPTGFESHLFFSSWLLPTPALACLRALLSFYAFFTIFYSFGWFSDHVDVFHLKDINLSEITFSLGASAIRKSFSYFTYLSYWGLACYFAVSSMHTFVYWRRRKTWLERWPRWLQAAHSVFYSTIVCFPPMVSAIYWGTMFVDRWYSLEFDRWSNLSIHALNTIFALLEITLPRTNILPWTHLGFLMLFMSLYLGLVYISNNVEHFYPYVWLYPTAGWKQVVAHVIGYGMAIVLVYNIVLGLIWLRRDLTEPGAKDGTHDSQHDDDMIRSDLEMASTKIHDRWDISWPQISVPMPRAAHTSTSTFDFGFGERDRYTELKSPRTPRLERDERGYWVLAGEEQPGYAA